MNPYRAVVRQAARSLRPLASPLDRFVLRRVESSAPRLARAIRDRGGCLDDPVIGMIEEHRARMALDDSPLGDVGSTHAGLTVRDAVAASKPADRAWLLYNLAKEYEPALVVELGTNVGISSAYLARANPGGRVVTFEGSTARLDLARRLHEELGLANVEYREGLFADTLAPGLRELPPVDMAFIDGHHQYQPTLDYFDLIWSHAVENAVFVFDDIRWSSGMARAWRQIRRDPRVLIAVDLAWAGICVTTRGRASRPLRTPPMLTYL